jgi:apolipoprotein D and lipocalin family protein
MSLLRMHTLAVLAAMAVAGCTTSAIKPIQPVAHVELPRFMGDWYVIAHIPSFIERNAYDAVESYELQEDGRIQTTFRYRNKSHDAPLKTMSPMGTVRADTGNAIWGMQFVWPIKAEYVVVYLNDDYTQTIIGRSARDYMWIMARSPEIPESDFQAHLRRLEAMGYDTTAVRRVPQETKAQ